MSYRRMKEVIEGCDGTAVPPGVRLVFMMLAWCENTKTGRCNPSVATLCRLTGYRRSKVLAALASLKRVRAVVVVRCGRRSSRYSLKPTALEVQSLDLKAAVEVQTLDLKTAFEVHNLASEVQNMDHPEQGRNRELLSAAPAARRVTSVTRPPDPRSAPLLRAFSDAHQAALGQPYPVAGGRDGAALRRALGTWEPAAITATLPAYFADDWRCANGPTIAKWVALLPSLLRRPARPSSGFVG